MILNIKKVVITMNRVVIIGSGPSGLFCALNAKKEDNEVIVLEKKDSFGKKILVTGSGKCNYWNSDQDINHYHSRSCDNLSTIINSNNLDQTLNILNKYIVPYIREGYYYPYSREASSVRDILVEECLKIGVSFKSDFEVKTVENEDGMFIINNELFCNKLVIATGSNAYYKDDNSTGYNIAKKFNHEVIEPLPSLVQLVSDEKYLKDWEGVRSFVNVSLYEDNNKLKEEFGEIMLTNYGVSGICIFNLSNIANILLKENKKVFVHINFLPKISINELLSREDSISIVLKSFLNSKLVKLILKLSNINELKYACDLNSEEKELLTKLLTDLEVHIIDTKGFSDSQTVSGGVSLKDIDMSKMESKWVKDLYFIGEVVDVDGDCGGYNLTFSFVSSLIAGRSIKND